MKYKTFNSSYTQTTSFSTEHQVMATSQLLSWTLFFSFFIHSSIALTSYDLHCSSSVPRPLKDRKILSRDTLSILYGYSRASTYLPKESEVQFVPYDISETSIDGVLHIKATIDFKDRDNEVSSIAMPKNMGYRTQRTGVGAEMFTLDGYWSQSDGNLCMIGSRLWYSPQLGNYTKLLAVLMLNLKKNSTVFISLVKGSLKIKDLWHDSDHFDTVSILGYNQNGYNYTFMSQANKSCSVRSEGKKSLSLGSRESTCSILSPLHKTFELEYKSVCGSSNCNPLGKDFDFLPRFMGLNMMGCSDEGKLHMYLTFTSNSIYLRDPPFDPNTTLVGEGFWDWKKNQLCLMACRVLNSTVSLSESYVGNCNFGISLRFSATIAIKSMSRVIGEIWTSKNKNDAGYFDIISFRSLEDYVDLPGLNYKYTYTNSQCNLRNDGKNSKKRYPSPNSHNDDMSFNMNLRSMWHAGYFRPLFVGNKYYTEDSHAQPRSLSQRLWNVSYLIGFNEPPNHEWHNFLTIGSRRYHKYRKIFAEGVYDSDIGSLCMIGCRYLPQNLKNLSENIDRYDCNISINVQFPPLNPSIRVESNVSTITGSIKSKRKQSDSLYFNPIQFSTFVIYAQQTEKVIERMEFEIVMILMSLTLSCIFIASQLYYVKRHPEVISSISLIMLGILILGLMIHLVLNFEANFSKSHNKQDLLLWREANEVIVRIITMVAFLLQFLLLQRTISAKFTERDWLNSEIRVLIWCIFIYIVGFLITWLVDSSTKEVHHSLWDHLQSYAGLIFDVFLVPQILFNLFSNSKHKALSVPFYFGMSLVHAIPRGYDVYRAKDHLPWFQGSFTYENTIDRDFSSPFWDIVIVCMGIVLALVVFVQQRFGGGCIVPLKLRRLAGYEQVSSVEVQMN